MIDFGPRDVYEWERRPEELTARQLELEEKLRRGDSLTSEEISERRKIETASSIFSRVVADRRRAEVEAAFMQQPLDLKLLTIYRQLRRLEERRR